MNKITSITFIILTTINLSFSQNAEYKGLWESVQELSNKRQPQKALSVLKEIRTKAESDNNQVQLIKCAIYNYELSSQYEEKYLENAIQDIEQVVGKAKTPERNIYYSILGSLYYQYYISNKWIISDRVQIDNLSNEIDSWSRQDFMNKCYDCYLNSLSDIDILQKTALNDYKAILAKTNNPFRKYRYSLFDFLSYKAIEFFSNNENNPLAYRITNQEALTSFERFTVLEIDKSYANAQNIIDILNLYQKMLKNSINNPEAFIQTELSRLEYVYNNIDCDNKDEIYRESLFNLERRFNLHPDIIDVMYQIANHYYNLSNKITINEKEKLQNTDYLQNALAYCKAAYKKNKNHNSAKKCYNLMQEITKKEISNVEYQNVIYPNEHFPLIVTFKNIENIYYKIVKIAEQEYYNKDINKKSHIDILLKRATVASGEEAIEYVADYSWHTTQIIMPQLEKGLYALLLSNKPDFNIDNAIVAIDYLQVSNIETIISYSENTTEIITCDRNTGLPIPNCKLTLFNQSKYYINGKISDKFSTNSGEQAKVSISNNIFKDIYSFILKVEAPDSNILFINLKSYNSNIFRTREETIFYTDRAVYRPGQTVYFKGIHLESDGQQHRVLSGKEIDVSLRDFNYSIISEQRFRTNKYGSFSGTFTIPTDVLNGYFQIMTSSGSISIMVEEYKRPTFKVEFETLNEQPKQNEELCVKVKALTYSGVALQNAKIKYTIKRQIINNYWSYYSRGTNEVNLESGTKTTNDEGIATICFKAICPQTNAHYYKPIYAFELLVDISDNAGETHTNSYVVRMSETTLVISSELPEEVNLSNINKDSISFIAKNINNEKLDIPLLLRVVKLKAPEFIYREPISSNSKKLDIQLYSEKEFRTKLPQDIYDIKKTELKNWKHDELVFCKEINKKIALSDIDLKNGIYLFEISAKDKFGDTVKKEFYTNIYSDKSIPVFSKRCIKIVSEQSNAQVGDKFNVKIFSYAKSGKVKLIIASKSRNLFNDYIDIENHTFNFPLEVDEEDCGGIYINAIMIADNRRLESQKMIDVAYTSRKLDIQLTTLRSENTMLSGSKEKWTVAIRNQSKPIDAELLIYMYDKSLHKITSSNYRYHNYPSRFNIPNFVVTPFAWTKKLSSTYGYTRQKRDYLTTINYEYDRFILIDKAYGYYDNNYYGNMLMANTEVAKTMTVKKELITDDILEEEVFVSENLVADYNNSLQISNKDITSLIRSDFRETAFFYPQLETDSEGNISIEFTMPDAITEWQLYGFAHQQNMYTGKLEQSFISKKELFVQANKPKILFENDIIDYSVRISNLSEETISAKIFIKIFDAYDNDITNELISEETKTIIIENAKNEYYSWRIKIPEDVSILKIRVGAIGNKHSDIEEFIIPVLTKKVLVTETMPITINDKGNHTFKFKKLEEHLHNKQYATKVLTFEYTPMPIWNAILTLPYISEYDSKFPSEVFNGLYANLISSYIVKTNPVILDIYNKIKASSPDEFLSELEKRQELKNIVLKETPWVAEARSENEQKERLALLFDINRLYMDKQKTIKKLETLQEENGGFTWIEGGRYTSPFITMNIIEGFIHLQKLGMINIDDEPIIKKIVNNSERYLDKEFISIYKETEKQNIVNLFILRYLYFKSELYNDISEIEDANLFKAIKYYLNCVNDNWHKYDLVSQSLSAIILFNTEYYNTAQDIIVSFNDRALYREDLGMYWRYPDLQGHYSSSIYGLTKIIEAYYSIANDKEPLSAIQRFLLNTKRSTMWRTGTANAEAIFALLIDKKDKAIVVEQSKDIITIGNDTLSKDLAIPGSGYIKKSWHGKDVKDNYSELNIDKTTEGSAWANMYWQYLTDYENVTEAEHGLKIKRQILKNNFEGDKNVYTEVAPNDTINLNDKIVVRITIDIDREMEFIHIKDVLPACFIPEQLTSGFRSKGGIFYYESIEDAAFNIFIDRLSKGQHILEYAVNLQQRGVFTAGITKVQCMYAPEFSGQTAGCRLTVE